MAGCAALGLSACDKPSDYLPKTPKAEALPSPPTTVEIQALRTVLRNCERAMEAGSEEIAGIAAKASQPASPALIVQARDACAGSADAIGQLPIWGKLKDPCLQAAHARETVAEGALDIIQGKGITLGVEALRNKIADQASASRACAGEISAAEQGAG